MDLLEATPNANRHPWETSRAEFLLSVLRKHSGLTQTSELLDVGAGDLFFSEKTNLKTGAQIDAVDNAFEDETSRIEAIRKIKELSQVQHKTYDAICALDVLEHVENDHEFMNLLLDMLKPGASMIISVPAYKFLFTQHDTNLKHFRRYSTTQVKNLVRNPEGFVFLERFYFFHSLYYLRAFEKLVAKIKEYFFGKPGEAEINFKSINQWKYAEHHPFTASLGTILSLDAMICRALSKVGIRLPGLSLCVVIQRKV